MTPNKSNLSIPNLFNVKNKIVLITGGSRGIGLMIAQGFVHNGAKVYITARSATDCHQTAQELTEQGPGTCIALPGNLQSLSEVKELVRKLSENEESE
jgi:NAD(P)-dependent dehydrogenase (short-subunit alcohol dehydrogenase family)